jgi:hypothetical protein
MGSQNRAFYKPGGLKLHFSLIFTIIQLKILIIKVKHQHA